MLNVISLGAGKQSSYMLLNAIKGKYEYKPEFAIFSDTGCEPDYVYSYFEWLKNYVKDKYNFDVIVVSEGNLMQDTIDYVEGNIKRVASLPLRLENKGLMPRQCTYDYKIKPIRKYLQKVRNKEKIRLWIGISLDEIQRIKESNVNYIEHHYPLIDYRTGIDSILEWYKKTGTAEPMKSACLICPFHSSNYWKRFKKIFPKEFKTACDFDDKIRNYPNLKSKTYLSKHLIPLKDIDFKYKNSLFPELIEECDGLCGL